jgi:hypothetical protein
VTTRGWGKRTRDPGTDRRNRARSGRHLVARDLHKWPFMRSFRLVYLVTAGLLVGAAPLASAHVQIRAPLQRTDLQKDGPCGAVGSVRGANVCTFRPGQTITIAWDETVEHPGHFRVAFDTDGQDFINPTTPADTDPTVIHNAIPDRDVEVDGKRRYTIDVTFPDLECDNCTLQLLQIMSTAATYVEDDLYYQCADIVLSNAAPETPDPNCVAPPAEDEPPPDDDDDDGDPPPDDDEELGDEEFHTGAEGGCAIGAAGGRGLTGTALLIVGLFLAQRRRRR